MSGPSTAPMTDEFPGGMLGHYRVEQLLGIGGMGRVYAGTDTKLGRRVAIKLLLHEGVDDGTRARFEREARMVSSLNHPHILTVYDAGVHGSRPYLVTEFVDGRKLVLWNGDGESEFSRTMRAADVGITKGNRTLVLEMGRMGLPAITIDYGVNQIDSFRVRQCPWNQTIQYEELTVERLEGALRLAI
ncbi:MAG: protein kinase domain-containing protein [Acidobacteriota bacterium]